MRYTVILLAGAVAAASPAFAADQLKFGPVPVWVVEQSVPRETTQATEAPVAQLLNDSQVRFEPGKITSFTEIAIKVQTPDGLSAGDQVQLSNGAPATVVSVDNGSVRNA